MYATNVRNVCRRDGDILLRTKTLEDELHTRVPLLLKTKLTSILPPHMFGVWGSSLKMLGEPKGLSEIFPRALPCSPVVIGSMIHYMLLLNVEAHFLRTLVKECKF